MALIPIMVGALVTIAWQNSHNLVVLTREYDDVKAELDHQRELLEQRLAGCSSKG